MVWYIGLFWITIRLVWMYGHLDKVGFKRLLSFERGGCFELYAGLLKAVLVYDPCTLSTTSFFS